jgi:hypothetical protein
VAVDEEARALAIAIFLLSFVKGEGKREKGEKVKGKRQKGKGKRSAVSSLKHSHVSDLRRPPRYEWPVALGSQKTPSNSSASEVSGFGAALAIENARRAHTVANTS